MRKHGTVSGYTSGCRCEDCRTAFRLYYREWRKRRRELGLPTQGRRGQGRLRPPRKVAAPTSPAGRSFVGGTDPLVLQAIRRVFNGHACDEQRCPHLPLREREALDAWLQPRVAALVEILAGEHEREVA